MSRSKKRPAAVVVAGVVGPVVRDGDTYLSEQDLYKVEMMQAKTLAAIQTAALAKRGVEDAKREAERLIKTAEMELAAVTQYAQACEKRTQELWADMGKAYGLDFRSVSYDDETGKIHRSE